MRPALPTATAAMKEPDSPNMGVYYSLSVHQFVDFLLRAGDIDNRIYNQETMNMGSKLHSAFQESQGNDYALLVRRAARGLRRCECASKGEGGSLGHSLRSWPTTDIAPLVDAFTIKVLLFFLLRIPTIMLCQKFRGKRLQSLSRMRV